MFRVTLSHAVDGQTSGHAVERDDLAPRDVRLEELSGHGAEDVADRLLGGYGDGNLST